MTNQKEDINHGPDTYIVPKWVTLKMFHVWTGISRSKAETHIRYGRLMIRTDGGNTMIDLWQYYQDLENGDFEMTNSEFIAAKLHTNRFLQKV